MAFQYAPGVTSTVGETAARSNQMLGSALMALMDNLGQAKEKQRLEAKQTKDLGSSADAWYRALGEDAQKVTGMPKEQWDIQGAADKSSAMHGVIQSQATQNLLMQQAQERRQAEGGTALQQVLKSAMEPTRNENTGKENDPTSRILTQFMAHPAAVQAPQGQNLLMDVINRNDPSRQFFKPSDPSVQRLPGINASRIVTGPNTSEVRFDAPTNLPEGFIQVPDAKAGYRVTRDYSKIPPDKLLTSLQRDARDLQSAIANPFASNKETLQAQLEDVHQKIGVLRAGGKEAAPAVAAAAAGAVPTVATQEAYDALASGATYLDGAGNTRRKK